MNLPEYKLIGQPYKIACHGRPSRHFYQGYRLLPNGKLQKAPCCPDKLVSQRKAVHYVEQHIGKKLRDPVVIHAATSITEHLQTYQESLTADKCNGKYIRMTLTRIQLVCKALKWRLISDIDGLTLKNWVAKQNWSLKTAKDYIAHCKAFTRFLFIHNRAETDPLARTTLAIKGDALKRTTRKRRCIAQEEFQRVLIAAANGPDVQGLSGEQRRMLYLLTAATGFRAHECWSLTPRSFDLDSERPSVMVDCTISKRRRYDTQELQSDVAEEFRRWLVGKDPDRPLWEGWWWSHASDMVQVDLKVAGVPFKTEAGFLDFHALGRVQYVTHLVATSAPLTLVQRIARLSSPALLDRYYRPGDADRSEVINALPALATG
jgi:integrase